MGAKRILIVDDEAVIHRLLVRGLADKGYELSEAYNGAEALKMVDAATPDLILLDVNMPTMDGRQVMKELRARPATAKTPVIMLTGLGDMMDKMAGFELGVDSYVTKPFQMAELIARIEGHLKGR